ncbi:MAG: hypothetical protein K2N34_00430 [Lachnospiraceae bacterium]|nr:hypothetical protein [Lachnospiraceae bacterium]
MDENNMEQAMPQSQPVELKKTEQAAPEQPVSGQSLQDQTISPQQQVPPILPQQQVPPVSVQQVLPQQAPPMSMMSPEEAQFFSGGMDEINVMIDDVVKRDNLTNEIRNIINEGKRLEKELEEEKRNLAKDINDTVNAEMAKAVAEEDRIINESNSKLKQIRSDRSKAKEQRVKNRIEQETSGMVEENRNLHRYIRKTLKENGLPSYCDTKWFYTLYCTHSGIEWLIKILVFLCGIVFIPGVVCAIVNPWWFLKIILWAVVMVVCIMVYMTIYLLTKDKDNGVLEEMREHRDKISDNDKRVKAIKKGIRSDTDESFYHLEEFDEQIAKFERNFDEAMKLKKQKLGDFELNQKQSVIDEVNKKHMPIMEAKQSAINEKLFLYNQKNQELNEWQQKIAEQYERFLSKPYTNAACLKRMGEMIQNGNASNIGQAFMLVKR